MESQLNRLQLEVFYEQLNYQGLQQEEAYKIVQLLSDLGMTFITHFSL